jgi:hypothetical protein
MTRGWQVTMQMDGLDVLVFGRGGAQAADQFSEPSASISLDTVAASISPGEHVLTLEMTAECDRLPGGTARREVVVSASVSMRIVQIFCVSCCPHAGEGVGSASGERNTEFAAQKHSEARQRVRAEQGRGGLSQVEARLETALGTAHQREDRAHGAAQEGVDAGHGAVQATVEAGDASQARSHTREPPAHVPGVVVLTVVFNQLEMLSYQVCSRTLNPQPYTFAN